MARDGGQKNQPARKGLKVLVGKSNIACCISFSSEELHWVLHRVVGRKCSETSVSRNWKEMRKQMRKCYHSNKSVSDKICAGTSKAAHKIFQERGASSIGELTLLHNLQFFA